MSSKDSATQKENLQKKREELKKKLLLLQRKRGNITVSEEDRKMTPLEKTAINTMIDAIPVNRKMQRRAVNKLAPEQYEEFCKKRDSRQNNVKTSKNDTQQRSDEDKKDTSEKTTILSAKQPSTSKPVNTETNTNLPETKNKQHKKKRAQFTVSDFAKIELTEMCVTDESTQTVRPMFVPPTFVSSSVPGPS